MVLNGVGAAKMKPKLIGMFTGKNELKRNTQFSNSPVSGWIAVEVTVYAIRTSLIRCLDIKTSREPVNSKFICSIVFYSSSNFYISLILPLV